jgi:nudix-type nucleoside diphosphatase (YffH/AdpP family)
MSQTIRSAQIVYEGRHEVLVATVADRHGDAFRREIIVRGAAACVLAYDPDRRTALMVRLPRTPVQFLTGQATMLEAVAGVIDDGETPEDCIRREAMEEAGVRLDALEPVGSTFTSPGYSTERLHLYLAPYAPGDRAAEGGGAPGEHEDIEPVETPLDLLWRMTERGEIEDLKTFALIHALKTRHPELFA